MPGPIKVTSARGGQTTTIPWGHIPTGVIWERIELDRTPETPAEQEWLRDQILVRLAPGGVVTTAVDGR